jgi:hypothetical protein
MSDLGSLLCGKPIAEGIAKSALAQLPDSISGFARRAILYLGAEFSEETLAFGPFCARVLLENSCAALVGRLDCFRLLYLSEFQTQPEYDRAKRVKSSFSWSGDVIPEGNINTPMWSADYDSSKISRALFSKHLDHVYWRPALEHMLDFVSAYSADPAIAELLSIDTDNYIDELRGRSVQLYSMLSKGVHWEFFTTVLVYDESTTKSAIRDTCILIGRLGLTSHFVPTAYASLTPDDAVNAYLSFRKELT